MNRNASEKLPSTERSRNDSPPSLMSAPDAGFGDFDDHILRMTDSGSDAGLPDAISPNPDANIMDAEVIDDRPAPDLTIENALSCELDNELQLQAALRHGACSEGRETGWGLLEAFDAGLMGVASTA